jgi:hypothetical protein
MKLWLIPMIYVGASIVCGFTLPRIEQAYLGAYNLNLSPASAQAYLSAAASGMMALSQERANAVRRYLDHLDLAIERSPFDAQDRVMARQEDRQGLGLSRRAANS